MSKLVLTDVQSLTDEQSAITTINNNSDTLVDAFDNTLSRDGSSPNQMGASLDMNSHPILNLPAPSSDTEPVRLGDLTSLGGGSGASSFIDLDDVPSDYTGESGKLVAVNSDENALIFVSASGTGDMLAATYDPTNKASDAFSQDNMADGTTNKNYTSTEQSKLSGIESGADVTDATNVDAAGAVMNSDTSTASMSFVVDEDGMDSNSATKVPTQQSVKAYVDAQVGGGGYTDEEAQDAVGSILVDSTEIDFTYTDATPSITASIKSGSIDETKLDTSVNASLDLADTAVQDLSDLSITATASELNTLDGITATVAELNILDGVTATAAELNALDGITATVTELNYTDGVTSAIQTQIDGKQTLDSDLTALAGLASTGLIARTGSGTVAARTVSVSGAGLSISNGSGVSGNPSISLTDDMGAIEALSGTGLARRTGGNTWTVGTTVATAEITDAAVTNAKMANMANSTIKLRNTTGSGAPEDVKISGLTAETSPAAGDFLLGELAEGTLVKIDIDDLPGGGGGASAFTDLSDVPSAYTGAAGKTVVVNAGATGLEFVTPAGGGDMLVATYDPNGVAGDAFDQDNMVDGTTNKNYTATEKTKLSGIATGADVTGTAIHAATSKIHPVDADEFGLIDSEASNVLKKLTWTHLKNDVLAGAGDMLASTYDPNGVDGDAFDQDNMVDGTTNKNYTATDKTKLAGIEAAADVTDATNVDAAGAVMNGDTSTASMSFVIDEDDMTSDSATKIPTQQSVKAYVDANIGGGGVSLYTSTITSSTTWVKATEISGFDPDGSVFIEAWGAGGGGGTSTSGGGGGGGAYVSARYNVSDLPSSVTVTIGAGGTTTTAGGDTSFGSLLTAFGGGGANTTATGGGGGGGGMLSAGGNASGATGGAAGSPSDSLGGGKGGTGAASASVSNGVSSVYGGGGGQAGASTGTGSDGHGGDSIYGGAGGGARTAGIGGTSTKGGNGGNSGVDGSVPGGGGGRNASGGGGQVRISIIG